MTTKTTITEYAQRQCGAYESNVDNDDEDDDTKKKKYKFETEIVQRNGNQKEKCLFKNNAELKKPKCVSACACVSRLRLGPLSFADRAAD